MQNRTAIWIFTVLLTLACIYQISFSFVTSAVESDAVDYAKAKMDSINQNVLVDGNQNVVLGEDTLLVDSEQMKDYIRTYFEREYLAKMENESVYPLLGYTYKFCKRNEINLGLDLKGGMAVTLELSVPDFVDNLAGNPESEAYREPFDAARQRHGESGEDFLDAFQEEFEKKNKDVSMAMFFHLGSKEKFESNMSNDEVISILRTESENAIKTTEDILRTRIDKFGVSQPSIQRQAGTGRILIELPGVKDKSRVRSVLQSTANLEFYDTYSNSEAYAQILVADEELSRELYPGYRDSVDAAQLAKDKKVQPKPVDTLANETADSTKLAQENVVDSTKESADTSKGDDLFEESETDVAGETAADTNAVVDYKRYVPLLSLIQRATYRDESGVERWQEGAQVGLVALKDTGAVRRLLKHPVTLSLLDENLKLLFGAKQLSDEEGKELGVLPLYAIKTGREGEALLTGEAIEDARQDFDQYTNEVQVLMFMNKAGAAEWATITEERAGQGKAVAIVLDDLVYSAPTIRTAITQGVSTISGGFTIDEATDLANILKAGKLPARARIVEESIIGPSLGADNIRSGLISFVIALLLVLAYMVFYYGKAGAVSDVALFANIFFLVGTLASLQASLTLPGIAGIVLTIGMAVDANVLIFERIREELRSGKGVKLAIQDGYKNAYSSIVDANITTLLTAIILMSFGSGPVKGFATTLTIGIFTSLFSAIFITRLIFTRMMDKKKAISFSTKTTAEIFTKAKYPFMKRRRVPYLISGAIIVVGLGSLITRQLDMGVEFTGGRTYIVEFNQEDKPDNDKLRKELAVVFTEDGKKQEPELKTIDSDYKVSITTKYLITKTDVSVNEDVEIALREGLKNAGYEDYTILESRSVDSQISGSILQSSLIAIILSLIVIFIYIVFRFRKWQFGLSAVAALFHDVLIVLGIFSLLYGVLPFSMEINQAFIAAILTVVGYSINDTVVVFDRIREYINKFNRKESEELMDEALNSTLSRTINTSMTTFVVLLVIFLFGGESVRGFTFTLLIGVAVGTYSSIFVAAPLAFDLSKTLTRKRKVTLTGDQR
jgi:SecD/SecF fusion protein